MYGDDTLPLSDHPLGRGGCSPETRPSASYSSPYFHLLSTGKMYKHHIPKTRLSPLVTLSLVVYCFIFQCISSYILHLFYTFYQNQHPEIHLQIFFFHKNILTYTSHIRSDTVVIQIKQAHNFFLLNEKKNLPRYIFI